MLLGGSGSAPSADDGSPGQERDQRKDGAGDDEAHSHSHERDEQGRGEASQEEPDPEQPFHGGEHRDAIFVSHAPLNQREAGDVEHGVAHTDDEKRCQREAGHGNRADEDQRQSPAGERDHARLRQVLSATEAERTERTEQAAEADRRVEETDTGVAHVQQLDRSDHDEGDQHPADEDLDDEVADEQGRVRIPPQYARSVRESKARRAIGADSATGVFRAFEADARRRRSGPGKGSGDEQAGRGGTGCGDEQSGQERAEERSDAFAGARGHVRRHQLAWRARERGEERGLDRPNQRPCAGDDRRERIGRLDGQVGRDDQRGRGSPCRAHEVDRSEHAITAISLHQSRRERGGDDRRDDSDGSEYPGRERPPGLVGDDQEDDEESPVGCGSGRPGDLDPANRPVSEHLSDCDDR